MHVCKLQTFLLFFSVSGHGRVSCVQDGVSTDQYLTSLIFIYFMMHPISLPWNR